jgi:hypothetical protein
MKHGFDAHLHHLFTAPAMRHHHVCANSALRVFGMMRLNSRCPDNEPGAVASEVQGLAPGSAEMGAQVGRWG